MNNYARGLTAYNRLLIIAMTKLLAAIVLSIAMLTNLNTHADNLSMPPTPSLTLQVPEPMTLRPGFIVPKDTALVAFTPAEYGTMLQISTGYKLWAKNYPLRNKMDELWELRIDTLFERLEVCHSSIEILQEDRQYAYDLFYEEREAADSAMTRNTVRTVLYVSGGVLVGTAIGIIIGTIAIN